MGELGQGMDVASMARHLVLSLVTMILSLSVHECAHAFVARRLGDPTAEKAGRLTLNPLVHIDPVGTLLLPAMSVVLGGVALIGWAKPTPFRPDKMDPRVNRRLGAALVSVAGPLSNLLLAALGLGILSVLAHRGYFDDPTALRGSFAVFLESMVGLNVGLALFNILPIPPLDGHRLLPPMFDGLVARFGRYGFGVLMLVFFFLPQVTQVIFYRPYGYVLHGLEHLFGIFIG